MLTKTTVRKIAVKCPICNGTGYERDCCTKVTCHKCKGESVLWTEETTTETDWFFNVSSTKPWSPPGTPGTPVIPYDPPVYPPYLSYNPLDPL